MYTINERENFYKFINDFSKMFKKEIEANQPISSLDNIFQFSLSNKIETFSNTYCVNVSSNNEPLFNFEITEYDKEKFISTLSYGFDFDQNIKDQINDEEFSCLLGDKEAYSNAFDTKAYGISLSIGKHTITDEEAITKILSEIELKDLMEDIYYKSNSQNSVYVNDLKNDDKSIENFLIKKLIILKNKS